MPQKEIKPWDPEYKKAKAPIAPSLTFFQKYFGPSFMAKKRKTDIELPSEGKEDDPRLTPGTAEFLEERKKRPLSKLGQVKEGYGVFKKLAEEGRKK